MSKYPEKWLNGLTVLAFLLMGAFTVFGAEQAQTKSNLDIFSGYWINEDSETESITGIEITVSNGKVAHLNIWGSCSPRNCDWTEMGARYSTSEEQGRLKILVSDMVGKETIVLSMVGNDRSKVDSLREFTDWRPTQKHELFFHRSRWSRDHIFETADQEARSLGYEVEKLDRSFDSTNGRWRNYVGYMKPALRPAIAKTQGELENRLFWAVFYVPKGDFNYKKAVVDSNRRRLEFDTKLWIFVDQETGLAFTSLKDGPPSGTPTFVY